MATNLISKIKSINDNDPTIIDQKYVKGGIHYVNTIFELSDIDKSLLNDGMKVYVRLEDRYYTYSNGSFNEDTSGNNDDMISISDVIYKKYDEVNDINMIYENGIYSTIIGCNNVPDSSIRYTILCVCVDTEKQQCYQTAYPFGNTNSMYQRMISIVDNYYGDWDKIQVFKGTDGISNGEKGYVPAPSSDKTNTFLSSDGTWKEVNLYDINLDIDKLYDKIAPILNPVETDTIDDTDMILIKSKDGSYRLITIGELNTNISNANTTIIGDMELTTNNAELSMDYENNQTQYKLNGVDVTDGIDMSDFYKLIPDDANTLTDIIYDFDDGYIELDNGLLKLNYITNDGIIKVLIGTSGSGLAYQFTIKCHRHVQYPNLYMKLGVDRSPSFPYFVSNTGYGGSPVINLKNFDNTDAFVSNDSIVINTLDKSYGIEVPIHDTITKDGLITIRFKASNYTSNTDQYVYRPLFTIINESNVVMFQISVAFESVNNTGKYEIMINNANRIAKYNYDFDTTIMTSIDNDTISSITDSIEFQIFVVGTKHLAIKLNYPNTSNANTTWFTSLPRVKLFDDNKIDPSSDMTNYDLWGYGTNQCDNGILPINTDFSGAVDITISPYIFDNIKSFIIGNNIDFNNQSLPCIIEDVSMWLPNMRVFDDLIATYLSFKEMQPKYDTTPWIGSPNNKTYLLQSNGYEHPVIEIDKLLTADDLDRFTIDGFKVDNSDHMNGFTISTVNSTSSLFMENKKLIFAIDDIDMKLPSSNESAKAHILFALNYKRASDNYKTNTTLVICYCTAAPGDSNWTWKIATNNNLNSNSNNYNIINNTEILGNHADNHNIICITISADNMMNCYGINSMNEIFFETTEPISLMNRPVMIAIGNTTDTNIRINDDVVSTITPYVDGMPCTWNYVLIQDYFISNQYYNNYKESSNYNCLLNVDFRKSYYLTNNPIINDSLLSNKWDNNISIIGLDTDNVEFNQRGLMIKSECSSGGIEIVNPTGMDPSKTNIYYIVLTGYLSSIPTSKSVLLSIIDDNASDNDDQSLINRYVAYMTPNYDSSPCSNFEIDAYLNDGTIKTYTETTNSDIVPEHPKNQLFTQRAVDEKHLFSIILEYTISKNDEKYNGMTRLYIRDTTTGVYRGRDQMCLAESRVYIDHTRIAIGNLGDFKENSAPFIWTKIELYGKDESE